MAVMLNKGGSVNLSKEAPQTQFFAVALGWDPVTAIKASEKPKGFLSKLFGGGDESPRPTGAKIDIDASVFIVGENNQLVHEGLLCFDRQRALNGALVHSGDNLTGEDSVGQEDEDDETIIIDLAHIPESVKKLAIVVNIYAARTREQHFGMIQNAFVRVYKHPNKKDEVLRYNLSEGYEGRTSIWVADIVRDGASWNFNAIGAATTDGSLAELRRSFH